MVGSRARIAVSLSHIFTPFTEGTRGLDRYGEKIHVAVAANDPPAGVDTQEDLDRVRDFVRAHASA